MTEPADQQPADLPPPSYIDTLLDRFDAFGVLRFLLRPASRWAICWLVALGAAGFAAEFARTAFDKPERRDGNWGHASIDFGGQWMMGRAILEGHGRQLYHRDCLRSVLRAGYPPGGEDPKEGKTDVDNLMGWMAGADDAEAPRVVASCAAPLAAHTAFEEVTLLACGVEMWTPAEMEHVTKPQLGGGLYPPIHAMIYTPVALFPPRIAYRLAQALILALVFFDGWLIQRMTGGRIWWPVASLLLFIFPGFNGCIILGQNGLLSLTFVLIGWRLLMLGQPGWAGVVWSLLAFKPVWAAALLLVPLLTRRWRMTLGMIGGGLAQIVLTLPFVGWQTWLDWLKVGQMGADDYTRQQNWIFLSRDLLGIPRRWMLTFDQGVAVDVEAHPWATILGWILWTVVFLLTLFVAWRGRRRMKALSGPAPAFVLLGAMFSCYHFMYYDVMIAVLPMLLLFTEPRLYGWAIVQRWPGWWRLLLPPLLLLVMIVAPPLASLLDPKYHFPPIDTFALLLLGAWCGHRVLSDMELSVPMDAIRTAKLAELGADVGGAHERLADQHGTDAGLL